MEKLAAIVLAGLLGYICLMLTSIDNKIDAFYVHGTQYTVLNEVTPQSFTGSEAGEAAIKNHAAARVNLANAGFLLLIAIGMFVTWHLSRIYHSHQWTKTILKKSFAHYQYPHETPAAPDAIHLDQDCVGDPPSPDGRIKESWLPLYARALYTGWRL